MIFHDLGEGVKLISWAFCTKHYHNWALISHTFCDKAFLKSGDDRLFFILPIPNSDVHKLEFCFKPFVDMTMWIMVPLNFKIIFSTRFV